jgi:hypothetical protein
MTPDRALALYKSIAIEDLIRIRTAIHRGDKFTAIAERAGLPVAVIKITAARSRRAAARAAKKAAVAGIAAANIT